MRVCAYIVVAFATALLARVEAANPPPRTASQSAQGTADRADDDAGIEFDPDGTSAAVVAGLAAAGVSLEVGESGAQAIEVIVSTGSLASQYLPPPYNAVAGFGLATLGGLVGAKDNGVSNGMLLEYLQAAFAEIGMRLDNIEQSLDKVLVSLDELTRMTRYTSQVVSQIYKEVWVAPFQRIHAAYSSLITTYRPVTASRSWDAFFEKAIMLRERFEREAFDAFAVTNLRDFLRWYEQYENPDTGSKINDMGMCGVALLFQYLMTVREELLLICEFGSHTKKKNCDSGTTFCWEIDDELSLSYAKVYKSQLETYDSQILSAYSQGQGGLGIAHLVGKSASELLKGVEVAPDGTELGFCFQCDAKTANPNCQDEFEPFNWPTASNRIQGNVNFNSAAIDDQMKCNELSFTKDWFYYDMECPTIEDVEENRRECAFIGSSGDRCRYQCFNCRGCPPPNRFSGSNAIYEVNRDKVRVNKNYGVNFPPNKQNMRCCSCACLSESDYNDEFAGTGASREKYARHCRDDEKLYDPLVNFVPTDASIADVDFLPLAARFRIARVNGRHLSISSKKAAFRDSYRDKWYNADRNWGRAGFGNPQDYVTAIYFRNDKSHNRKARTLTYNGWTSYASPDPSAAGGVAFGRYAVQIGDWRISASADGPQERLSVTHENGNVSRIYRCNGKSYGTNLDGTYSGYNRPLGEPTCAYAAARYLQIGNWRIGRWNNLERHVSVTHRNGQTVEMYRDDGKTFGSNNGGNLWNTDDDVLAGSSSGCSQIDTSSSKCF